MVATTHDIMRDEECVYETIEKFEARPTPGGVESKPFIKYHRFLSSDNSFDNEEVDDQKKFYVEMRGLCDPIESKALVKTHNRYASSSSSSSSSSSGEGLKSPALTNNVAQEETIYSEIIPSQTTSEKTAARITRQSDNPILRDNSCAPPVRKTTSLVNLTSMREGPSTPSTIPTIRRNTHYENILPSRPKFNNAKSRQRFSLQFDAMHYANVSDSPRLHYTEPARNNSDNSRSNDESIYENEEETRDRSTSRPIEIQQQDEQKGVHYSQVHPSSSSILSSSPHGSLWSSASSDVFNSSSFSPPAPPLPYSSRRTFKRSWSNMSACGRSNYIPAHYLGTHTVQRMSRDTIDNAVSHVAQNTNVLEMRPVYVEVTNEFIRFGTQKQPWEMLVTFSTDDVVTHSVVLKNACFIGIVVCKAQGDEGKCYVLHIEEAEATMICDAIGEVFNSNLQNRKPSFHRQSSFHRGDSIDSHVFNDLVRVGSIKVKKPLPAVNEYIKLLLEKANPKESRKVHLELKGRDLVIKNDSAEKEEHHLSDLLSMAVYENEPRYFGYILNDTKNKITCHVYRATRNKTATKFVDTLHVACQNVYASLNDPIYDACKSVAAGRESRFSVSTITNGMGSCNSTPNRSCNTTPNQSLPPSIMGSPNVQRASTPVESPKTLLSMSIESGLNRSSSVVSKKKSNENLISFEATGEQSSSIETFNSVDSGISDRVSLISFEPEQKSSAQPIYSMPIKKETKTIETQNTIDTKQGDTKTKHRSFINKGLTLMCKGLHLKCEENQNNNSIEADDQLQNLTDSYHLDTNTYIFKLKYVCSSVINPHLKPKYIKECHKQFVKTVTKMSKPASSIGGTIRLKIDTKAGVSMLDLNTDEVRRTFAIDALEEFAQHPEKAECFAFTTSDSELKNKHKMHLFVTPLQTSTDDIKKAFDQLAMIRFLRNNLIEQ